MKKRWSTAGVLFILAVFHWLLACQLPCDTDEKDRCEEKSSQDRGFYTSSLEPNRVKLYFEWPKGGEFRPDNFYNFPYPNDLRRDSRGRPKISPFPNPKRRRSCPVPNTSEKFVADLLRSINADRYIQKIVELTAEDTVGFSLNPAVYFRFTGELDPRSFPPPAATVRDDSPVFLVDIDKKSPQRGRKFPLWIKVGLKSRFLPANTVIMRPVPGFVLRPNTTYAAVILTKVWDKIGRNIGVNPKLQSLLSGKSTGFPPKMSELYRELGAFLREEYGIGPEQVAAATVFTTGDPTAELKKLRQFILTELPEPELPSDVKCRDPGGGVPYILCQGTYRSPQFQKGKSPFLNEKDGYFTYGPDGKPNYTWIDIRFALSLPKSYFERGAVSQRKFPIVLYAHGTGGNYLTFVRNLTARRLARAQIAVFGIDQAVNGERTIKLGNMRLDFLFFNALNLRAGRDNVRQSALDYYWQVRLIKKLKIKHGGIEVRFDPKKIWFMGHSQGGLIGPPILAFEGGISAAYLSAPGGFLIHTLLYKTKPEKPLKLSEVLQYLLCDERGSIGPFHPVLGLLQHLFDPADPVNYSPLLLDKSRPPLNLFMTVGQTDGYAPPQVFDPLVIAADLPLLGPEIYPVTGFKVRSLRRYNLPVSANYLHPSGKLVTVGFTQHRRCIYPNGLECDGHFVAFYNPDTRRHWLSFFRTLLLRDYATIY